jgi:hypothetical protein
VGSCASESRAAAGILIASALGRGLRGVTGPGAGVCVLLVQEHAMAGVCLGGKVAEWCCTDFKCQRCTEDHCLRVCCMVGGI